MNKMNFYNIYSIDMNLSLSEGLAYVYFDIGDFRYFTFCRFTEVNDQDTIYIEHTEQTQSVYSNNISYSFLNNGIQFEFDRYIETNIHLKSPIRLFYKTNSVDLIKLKSCLYAIFQNK